MRKKRTICMVLASIVSLLFFFLGATLIMYFLTSSRALIREEVGEYGFVPIQVNFTRMSFDRVLHSDIDASLLKLTMSGEPFTKSVRKALDGSSSYDLVAYVEHLGVGAVAFELEGHETYSCVIIPFKKSSDTYVFNGVANPASFYVGDLVGLCNQNNQFTAPSKLTYVNFLYFDIFSCFRACTDHFGLKYIAKSSQEDVEYVLRAYQAYFDDVAQLTNSAQVFDSSRVKVLLLVEIDDAFYLNVEYTDDLYGVTVTQLKILKNSSGLQSLDSSPNAVNFLDYFSVFTSDN